MKSILILSWLFLSVGVFSQQEHPSKLLRAIEADAVWLDSIKARHDKILPKNLQKEIDILDSIMNRICQNDSKRLELCEDLHSSFDVAKNKFRLIDRRVNIADDLLLKMEVCIEDAEKKAQIGSIKDFEQYEEHGGGRLKKYKKDYEKMVESILKDELKLANGMLRYIRRYIKKGEPLISTLVYEYLNYNRNKDLNELHLELDAFEDSLVTKIQSILLMQEEINSSKIELEEQKNANSKLVHFNLILKDEQEHLKTAISDLNLALEGKSIVLSQKADSLTEEQSRLMLARHRLRDSILRLNALGAEIFKMENDLALSKSQLTHLEADLKQKEAELNHEEKESDLRLYGFLASLALGLGLTAFLLFRKKKNERYARYRLEIANRNLRYANDQLTEKKEKLEALFKELPHRTKNNLEQINSLLFLHEKAALDPASRRALSDARESIEALGIIYKQLYRHNDQRLTFVNIAEYVEELTVHLHEVNAYAKDKVHLELDLQNLFIDMDEAINVGLVLNELMQNSFKHAFPKSENPRLEIRLKAEGNLMCLSVRDNGQGLPQGVDIEKTSTFGLKLVRKLVEGSDGSFWYDGSKGACFIIQMPVHLKDMSQAA